MDWPCSIILYIYVIFFIYRCGICILLWRWLILLLSPPPTKSRRTLRARVAPRVYPLSKATLGFVWKVSGWEKGKKLPPTAWNHFESAFAKGIYYMTWFWWLVFSSSMDRYTQVSHILMLIIWRKIFLNSEITSHICFLVFVYPYP